MAKFSLHNENGDFMYGYSSTLETAISLCNAVSYKCRVMKTYMAKSPWRPWDKKLVEHLKEVYRNY